MKRTLVEYLDMLPLPALVLSNSTKKFKYVNDAAIQKYGYSREEFSQLTPFDIRPKEDIERAKQSIEHFKQLKHGDQGIWRHLTKAGKILYVKIMTQPVTCDNEECMLATVADVSPQLELNQHSNDILSSLFEFALTAIVDADGIIQDCSEALCTKFNTTYQHLIGEPLRSILGDKHFSWSYCLEKLQNEHFFESLQQVDISKSIKELKILLIPVSRHGELKPQYLFFAMDV